MPISSPLARRVSCNVRPTLARNPPPPPADRPENRRAARNVIGPLLRCPADHASRRYCDPPDDDTDALVPCTASRIADMIGLPISRVRRLNSNRISFGPSRRAAATADQLTPDTDTDPPPDPPLYPRGMTDHRPSVGGGAPTVGTVTGESTSHNTVGAPTRGALG